jgi:hypothetical protein
VRSSHNALAKPCEPLSHSETWFTLSIRQFPETVRISTAVATELMMNSMTLRCVLTILLLAGPFAPAVHAAQAVLEHLTGNPAIYEVGAAGARTVSLPRQGAGYRLPIEIETGPNDTALFQLPDSEVSIAPNTVMRVAAPQPGSDGLLQRIFHKAGAALFSVDRREVEHFQVETPFLVSVVKGTTFNVVVHDDGATVSLHEGRLQVASIDGHQQVMLAPGDVAFSGRDGELKKLTHSVAEQNVAGNGTALAQSAGAGGALGQMASDHPSFGTAPGVGQGALGGVVPGGLAALTDDPDAGNGDLAGVGTGIVGDSGGDLVIGLGDATGGLTDDLGGGVGELIGDLGDGVGDLGGATGDLVGDLGGATGDLVADLGAVTGDLIGDLGAGVGDLTGDLSAGVGDLVGGVGGGAGDLVGDLSGGAGDLLGGVDPGLGDLVGDLGGATGDLVAGTTDTVGDLVGGLGGSAADLVTDVTDTTGDLTGDLAGSVGDLTGDLTGTAGDLTGDLTGTAGDLLTGGTDGDLDLGDTVGDLTGAVGGAAGDLTGGIGGALGGIGGGLGGLLGGLGR